MNASYTLIIAAKRITPFRNCPELWDIIERKDFGHPKLMRLYLTGCGLLFKGFEPLKGVKIELHEGRQYSIDVSRKPMLIKSAILPGKTIYRPCVFFPNGNVQDLRTFFDHWQQLLVALGKDYDPKKLTASPPRRRDRVA